MARYGGGGSLPLQATRVVAWLSWDALLQTLQNLEVFSNSQDGSTRGTLFELLCHTITPFGKRLFRYEGLPHWPSAGAAIEDALLVQALVVSPAARSGGRSGTSTGGSGG